MPHVEHAAAGRKATRNALAVMLKEGLFTELPPGAVLAIVDGAQAYPIALERIDRNTIAAKCACGRKGCTRRVVFKATWKGIHVGEELPTGR